MHERCQIAVNKFSKINNILLTLAESYVMKVLFSDRYVLKQKQPMFILNPEESDDFSATSMTSYYLIIKADHVMTETIRFSRSKAHTKPLHI